MTRRFACAAVGGALFLTGCMVGPKYQRPAAPMVPTFKEPPPDGWKEATPIDGVLRGRWWEIFENPELNGLEEQVSISNQNVLAAEAQYRAARETVRIARAALFPTIGAAPSLSFSRTYGGTTTVVPGVVTTTGGTGTTGTGTTGTGTTGTGTTGTGTTGTGTTGTGTTGTGTTSSTAAGGANTGIRSLYNLPVDLSYELDIWGAIRRSVQYQTNLAQASEAQLENARLSYQALLAQDYFSLRGLDRDRQLLERTVKSYEDFLTLTQNRQRGGVASGGDVAQAETQVETARSQLIDLDVLRNQYEHAIAVLTGHPPAMLRIDYDPQRQPPPAIPVSLPSQLLERRPDIAASERTVAAQNEQIGIAIAAYYPTISLSGSAGLQSSSFTSFFSAPARFWSVGPSLAETLFDAGRRRAVKREQQDLYDADVANYRQTVLTAFQQVEDDLSALRVLEREAASTARAVDAAERSLQIATFQYKAGTTSYLTVITDQALALQNERTAEDLLTRRMVSSVLLIQALGGGWDISNLPTGADILANSNQGGH